MRFEPAARSERHRCGRVRVPVRGARIKRKRSRKGEVGSEKGCGQPDDDAGRIHMTDEYAGPTTRGERHDDGVLSGYLGIDDDVRR